MCRMLVALGEVPVKQVMEDFRLMALNRNERHELNKEGAHDSGWGIIFRKGGKLRFYKKEIPCWKDPKLSEFEKLETDFLCLHARKKSAGKKIYEDTHPFRSGKWLFCHNGTITDGVIKDFKSPKILGNTDSERFFHFLLRHIRNSKSVAAGIRKAVGKIEKYTGLNFILTDGARVFVYVGYKKYPRYYTMKRLRKKKLQIISSEKLPSFRGEWADLENGSLLEI